MKVLIFATFIALALAEPEAAPPATKYGVPDGNSFNAGASFGGNQGGNANGGGFGGGNGAGNAFAGQLFQLVAVGGNGNAGASQGSFGAGQGGDGGSFGGNQGFGSFGAGQGQQGSFGNAAAGGGSFGGQGNQGSGSFGNAAAGGGQTQITKDVYVHVPPPEDSEEFAGNKEGGAVQRKHYKIIFIKAPSVSIEQQLAAQSAAQTEEKTIVYVLVKKPDLTPAVDVDKSQNAANNKPEVYFIKYKGQREGGQGTGGNAGGNGGNSGFGGGNGGNSGFGGGNGGNSGFGGGNGGNSGFGGGNGGNTGGNTYVPPPPGSGPYHK